MGLQQTISAEILNILIIVFNTRYQDKKVLCVSKTKLEITKRVPSHHGAINWNTLPD